MDEQEHGFDQVVPTADQSWRFLLLLWRVLRYGSLQELEGNSLIGPAANMDNGPDVFWGVPHFVPGFELYTSVNGQPNTPIATIAEFKQRLVIEIEFYTVVNSAIQVDTIQDPFHEDPLTIKLRYFFALSTHPGGAIQKIVFILIQVMTRNLNGSEIHFSVEQIYLYWHYPLDN